MTTSDVQHEVMRTYRALIELREEWGGGLVLLCGPGSACGGGSVAVGIAGGATLVIDSDAAAMKAAMRAGALDFVVNTLDEALRALKNQVRLRRPVGVGLVADVDATLAEMVERGVQPDLHIMSSGCDLVHNPSLESLAERGMRCDSFVSLLSAAHHEYFFAANDAAELAAIDAALLDVMGDEDVARRRWVTRVPQYVREARSGGRWIWLSDQERQRLAASVCESEQARP
ncbi:MAG TPA: hypothetical protein VGU46_05635 [Acidobacteriaceae bacterium]|nr:hypothetical protein [Acidobacteriaceae bacterium]